jgi:hypothetical protein
MGVIVRQKAPGKGQPWWIFITYRGRRKSQQVGDKRAAEAVASQIRAKLHLGDFKFDERENVSIPTFKLYAENVFMPEYAVHNHKESTQASYGDRAEKPCV